MPVRSFERFFKTATGHGPHPWQLQLGQRPACGDLLVRGPSGLGKTAGVALSGGPRSPAGMSARF